MHCTRALRAPILADGGYLSNAQNATIHRIPRQRSRWHTEPGGPGGSAVLPLAVPMSSGGGRVGDRQACKFWAQGTCKKGWYARYRMPL